LQITCAEFSIVLAQNSDNPKHSTVF